MKFLVINTDYPAFISWLYKCHPHLYRQSYEEQMRARIASLFGFADFYSNNLVKLGHEAHDIFFNNTFMQGMWAREHGLPYVSNHEWQFYWRKGFIPWFSRFCNSDFFNTILDAQIRFFKPDVVLNFAMNGISTSFLEKMKPYFSLLIGSGEPPILYEKGNWRIYDVIFAPSEAMVDYFREIGINTELHRFGFESRISQALTQSFPEKIPVSFVGSITKHHSRRHRLLESVCSGLGRNISIWAPSIDRINKKSPIYASYKGPAWGSLLFQILFNSKISLNCHIDAAGEFADNMRLFESTGMGTLLLTDWKQNLHNLFDLDMEIVTYRNPMECTEKIYYYLEHETERSAIAKAGQVRTLKEHTYYHRAQELVEIVRKYL